MSRISRNSPLLTLIVGLALGTGACSKHEKPPADTGANLTEPAQPAVPAVPAEPAAPTEMAPSDEHTKPTGNDALAYTISAHKHEQRGQTALAMTMTALSHMGNITIDLKNFSYYCEPVPSFTASAEGRELILTLNKATAVARCMGIHEMKLEFAGIDMKAGFDTVKIVGVDGKEQGSASITRAR